MSGTHSSIRLRQHMFYTNSAIFTEVSRKSFKARAKK